MRSWGYVLCFLHFCLYEVVEDVIQERDRTDPLIGEFDQHNTFHIRLETIKSLSFSFVLLFLQSGDLLFQ